MGTTDIEHLAAGSPDAAYAWFAGQRDKGFLLDLYKRASQIDREVAAEIKAKFAAAFPRRFYVFLVQRPCDVRGNQPPWPVILSDPDRAERYEYRVGPVVEVLL